MPASFASCNHVRNIVEGLSEMWLGDFTRRQSLRLRRGDRLSPRAAKHYRPSSAQVTYGGFGLASCVTFSYGNLIVDKSDNLHFFNIIIYIYISASEGPSKRPAQLTQIMQKMHT